MTTSILPSRLTFKLRRFCGVVAGPVIILCCFASPGMGQTAAAQQATSYNEQKVTASDGTTNSFFGSAAALDGATALIGADGENSFEGAAYIFTNVGGVWTEGQKLTPSDGLAGDEFGYRTALRRDTAIVTAFSATIGGNAAQGSAYVFTQSSGVWSETQKLLASDGGLFDNFGASVTISSNVLAIGANGATVGQNPAQGAVYVFTKSGSTWVEVQKLVADDGAAFDNFGLSVALDDQTILAGAPAAVIDGKFGQGAVYRFARINGVWTQVQKLVADDGLAGDSFGQSVALNQRAALVSAYNVNVNGNPGQGAVYVFDRSGGLVQGQKLTACRDKWYNQTLCKVNDSVVRLGVMQGEYHWHKHDRDDEFFFVLEGQFIIDLEDRSVDLGPQEGFVVSKGLVHRTRAPERAVMLMVENAGIVPTGDEG